MSMVSEVKKNDRAAMEAVERLLLQEGIKLDASIDYTCAAYDEEYRITGTGSCFGNTLRCFAVDSSHQGEGILNEIISHLCEVQMMRGNVKLFLYTKPSSARFFEDLGYHEIARVEEKLVFMENRQTGFDNYLDNLKNETSVSGKFSGAIVMNANPFTRGHQYLVETAAAGCDVLHLFTVSEDSSLVPFAVRKRLVREGCAHLKNIVFHDSGPYIISNATFPSYFLKDSDDVIHTHAALDAEVFSRIAESLSIKVRFVGEEPVSHVTGIYNSTLSALLPGHGVECRIIERLRHKEAPISASAVRVALKTDDFELLSALLPESSLKYFMSDEASPVIKRIKAAADVVHY